MHRLFALGVVASSSGGMSAGRCISNRRTDAQGLEYAHRLVLLLPTSVTSLQVSNEERGSDCQKAADCLSPARGFVIRFHPGKGVLQHRGRRRYAIRHPQRIAVLWLARLVSEPGCRPSRQGGGRAWQSHAKKRPRDLTTLTYHNLVVDYGCV